MKNANTRNASGYSRWLILLPMIVACSFLGVVGCDSNSSNPVTNVPADTGYDIDAGALSLVLADSLATVDDIPTGNLAKNALSVKTRVQTATGKAKYNRNGFTIKLKFPDGEAATFVFAKGAIDEKTLKDDEFVIAIEGYKVNSGDGAVYFYECGPHGLEFVNPIKLTQEFDGKDGGQAGLFYNFQAKWYSLEEVSNVKQKKAVFSIHHFSKYGISR